MDQELVCLDTSVLIDYFRKKNKKKTSFYTLTKSDFSFAVTSITLFEIYAGSNQDQLIFWDDLFSERKLLNFDAQTAKIAAECHQKLKRINKAIHLADLFIASICHKHKVPLATLNQKDFERVDSLSLLKL